MPSKKGSNLVSALHEGGFCKAGGRRLTTKHLHSPGDSLGSGQRLEPALGAWSCLQCATGSTALSGHGERQTQAKGPQLWESQSGSHFCDANPESAQLEGRLWINSCRLPICGSGHRSNMGANMAPRFIGPCSNLFCHPFGRHPIEKRSKNALTTIQHIRQRHATSPVGERQTMQYGESGTAHPCSGQLVHLSHPWKSVGCADPIDPTQK